MKDLIEAYNSIYQLDEISFNTVGTLGRNLMNMPAGKPQEKKPEQPSAQPEAKPAAPAAQPSAMDQWKSNFPKLAAASAERERIRGTNQTDNPLIDAEMRARMPAPTKNQDPNFQSTMKSGQYGDQGHQSLTQNKYVTKVAEPTTSTAKPAPASPPAMTAAANQAISSLEQSARAKKAQEPLNMNKWFPKVPQMNSYDYGNIDPDQLTSLLDAYQQVYQEQVKVPADASDAEALKGLIPKGDKVHETGKKKLDAHFEPEGEDIHEIPLVVAAPLVAGGVGLAANAIGRGMKKFVDTHSNTKPSDYKNQQGLGAKIAGKREMLQKNSYQPEGELVDESGYYSSREAQIEDEKKHGEKIRRLAARKRAGVKSEEVEQIEEAGDDPCWKGYTQVGMKKKGGREVPNCVPSKGVPKAKGYKKEEAELEEGAANLIRLGLGVGTAIAGAKLAKKATEVRDTLNKKQKEKEEIIRKTLGNSYEAEGELVEAYDLLLGYLMEEGFAANVENAEKIMMVMSDEWMQSVLEQDLTARQKYLMGKVEKMNSAKAGSAHTYTSGKQNPGAALDRANRSAAQMRGV